MPKDSPLELLAEHLSARSMPVGSDNMRTALVADWLDYSLNRCGLVVVPEHSLASLEPQAGMVSEAMVERVAAALERSFAETEKTGAFWQDHARAAIAALTPSEQGSVVSEHPLAKMTRLDEELGLYDDGARVPLSPNAERLLEVRPCLDVNGNVRCYDLGPPTEPDATAGMVTASVYSGEQVANKIADLWNADALSQGSVVRLREALEAIRSACNNGVNDPGPTLNYIDTIAIDALSANARQWTRSSAAGSSG